MMIVSNGTDHKQLSPPRVLRLFFVWMKRGIEIVFNFVYDFKTKRHTKKKTSLQINIRKHWILVQSLSTNLYLNQLIDSFYSKPNEKVSQMLLGLNGLPRRWNVCWINSILRTPDVCFSLRQYLNALINEALDESTVGTNESRCFSRQESLLRDAGCGSVASSANRKRFNKTSSQTKTQLKLLNLNPPFVCQIFVPFILKASSVDKYWRFMNISLHLQMTEAKWLSVEHGGHMHQPDRSNSGSNSSSADNLHAKLCKCWRSCIIHAEIWPHIIAISKNNQEQMWASQGSRAKSGPWTISIRPPISLVKKINLQ